MKITNKSGTFTGKRYCIVRSTHGNIWCTVDGKIQRWTKDEHRTSFSRQIHNNFANSAESEGLITDEESLDYLEDLARVVERYLFTPSMIEEGEADILAVTQLLKDGTIGWPEDGFAWDDDVLVQNKKENQ